jgi:hypothetical protein
MRTASTYRRLLIALAAGVILVAVSASASAEDQYKRVTADELKRIQKQNDEEQRRLEATPEYQARKAREAEERNRREREAFLARERELKLQKDAADLRHKELENQKLANQNASSQGSGSSTNTVVVTPPYLPYFPYFNVPRIAVAPFPIRTYPVVYPPHVRYAPVIRPAIRIRR